MRNPSIELFRYVFAFLVVFIHVPLLHGGMLLMPLARCAVPFFYLISGFFLAKKTCNVDLIPFMPTAKKWILMWGKYFVVFAIIGVLIDWYCGNITYPNIKDFASLVLTGQCMYVDEHIVATHKLGLLTLWFLYEGALAFALIYVLRKNLYSKVMLIVVMAVQLVAAIFVHKGITTWLFPYSSFPFLYYGMWLSWKDKTHHIVKKKMLLIAACFLYILGMVEYKCFGDVVFVNLPFSVMIFMLITSSGAEKILRRFAPPILLGILQKSTPVTLDIYIWHRLVYVLIMLLGIDCYGMDAIMVFVITLLASCAIRYCLKINIIKK